MSAAQSSVQRGQLAGLEASTRLSSGGLLVVEQPQRLTHVGADGDAAEREHALEGRVKGKALESCTRGSDPLAAVRRRLGDEAGDELGEGGREPRDGPDSPPLETS